MGIQDTISPYAKNPISESPFAYGPKPLNKLHIGITVSYPHGCCMHVNPRMQTKTICKWGSPGANYLAINPHLHMGILIRKRGSPYAYIRIWGFGSSISIEKLYAKGW
jgi:hypothetical protein